MAKALLVAGDRKNKSGYQAARYSLDGLDVWLPTTHHKALVHYISNCKKHGIDIIITCDDNLLVQMLSILKMINPNSKKKVGCHQWAGASFNVSGVKVIITRGFMQINTTPTGKAIFRRHVYKNLYPAFKVPDLTYEVIKGNEVEKMKKMEERLSTASLIAVDVETLQKPVNERVLAAYEHEGRLHELQGIYATMKKKSGKATFLGAPIMEVVGYTGLWNIDGKLVSHSYVLYTDTMSAINCMRRVNMNGAEKIMQNGGYDCTYFARYNAPLNNYLWDTFHLMHSWYAELPRTLDFIAGYFLPNYQYWKDLASSDPDFYNAMDTHATLWAFVAIIMEIPQWARDNYVIEFRKLFPNLTMGLEGLKVEQETQKKLHDTYTARKNAALERLETLIAKGFNPNSPKQVLSVMNALSKPRVFKSSDDKNLEKWKSVNPICAVIGDLLQEYREVSKALSTFIDARQYCGRLLYELNAGGTVSGRSASKASNLWTGTQIQNQDNKLRDMYVADEGYVIANCDGSQAESRTTAYISEDENLMHTVETAPDFHTRNASLFFGIPEEQIEKPIRTLSKRVNHGSNYNMSEFMLLETMGHENVMEAKRLLKMPDHFKALDVCAALLRTFIKTYPDIKGKYYDEVIDWIQTNSRLTIPTDDSRFKWTRFCFGKPSRHRKDKKHLNEYVSHLPQSLSVMMVDDALFEFWYEYQIKRGLVRLKAQVHDEIVYQVRSEYVTVRFGELPFAMVEERGIFSPIYSEITKEALSNLMARPVVIRGRELIIPNDGGGMDYCWGNLKD
jgi:hypothetical protein